MTEDEFKSGVKADGSRLMQPDNFAASREAAEAITNAPSFDYVAEAFLTLSPSWHGDKVLRFAFVERLNGAIRAANNLDQVKKTLFYGKNNGLGGLASNVTDLPERISDRSEESATNVIHAVIGIFTEAGELLEALRDAFDSGNFDDVNAKEETGDLFWYLAILARECNFTFDQSQRKNIAKLRARFPDRFTEFDANNRNLSVERAILETPSPSIVGTHIGGNFTLGDSDSDIADG